MARKSDPATGPITLEMSSGNPLLRKLLPLAGRALERVLCVGHLNRLYWEIVGQDGEASFVDKVLDVLDITYRVSDADMDRIPRDGPVVVVSNHPFGAVDGVILNSILLSARSDVKVMANYILGKVPELRNHFMLVDPFGRRDSIRANIGALRDAIQWVSQGGVLGMFPAGEVAHFRLSTMKRTESEWGGTVARIVRKTHAPVLPVFFPGSNSLIFHVLGLVHPMLRTVMLPREMLKKIHTHVDVRIGKLIPHEKLARFRSDKDLTQYLQLRTQMLARRGEDAEARLPSPAVSEHEPLPPVVPPRTSDLLVAEVRNIPPQDTLVDAGRYRVLSAWSADIPHVLHEIGRLREITFRQAGEGTGKPIDIDRYDAYYKHVFLWDNEADAVVGSYRLGLTDRILRDHGVEGMYTSTLFEYHPRFVEKISCALELGRSFVRVEYQKTYHPLMLLWKGIGCFVARNPQYHILFGPVSMTNDYYAVSRQLIVAFLKAKYHGSDLAPLVRPRNPFRKRLGKGLEIKTALALFTDIQDLSDLVSDIEEDQKGIPILFKQYLKLGGKFLGFSVDPNFNDTLDALILVDVTQRDRRILERYMGKEEAAGFIRHHEVQCLEHCA